MAKAIPQHTQAASSGAYTPRYHVNFFVWTARLISRTPLRGYKLENILSSENSHGIQVIKAGLQASNYKESVRYAAQVDSCLNWFQVSHTIPEVAGLNPSICIFAAS